MVELSAIAPYVFGASFIVYIIIVLKKSSDNKSEEFKLNQLEKLAEYFSSANSLEQAMRQLVKEQPASSSHYEKVIKKRDSGSDMETALSQAAQEIEDAFLSKICTMLIFINRKNDARLLYDIVQKMKEASDIQDTARKSSEVSSWTIQFVFAMVIPMIYFFMISTLGFESDIYLNAFLGVVAFAPALFQGVVYKQWAESLVKMPLLLSIFYMLFFVIAPKFFSQLLGSF